MQVRMWMVKKGRELRDKRGIVIGRPGDKFPYDSADALRQQSAVVAVAAEPAEPAEPELEPIEEDPFDHTHQDDPLADED